MFGLAAALAIIGVALRTGGLQTAANVAQLVSVILAIPALAVPLWLWSHKTSEPVAITPTAVANAKDALARLISRQWEIEEKLRSLNDPDPIPVQWNVTDNRDVIDHAGNLTSSSLLLTASSDNIPALVREFRALRRRRLVIIGGPGAGKTTLAVQLVRELLATRSESDAEPVPVLLSVADWDTKRFQQLHDWVAYRIDQDYPALRVQALGKNGPKELARNRQILPILDGLDELPAPAQAAVIKALNRSLASDDHLIVTSRTTEYIRAVDRAGAVLRSALVIAPEPLNRVAAADYLRRCLPPNPDTGWERMLGALRDPNLVTGPTATLAQVTATPLGLWLLRTVYVYQGDPASLLDPAVSSDPAALRAHLFDRLIPALVDTRHPREDRAEPFRPRRRHDSKKVKHWLSYLAHHLTYPLNSDRSPRTRDLAWWRIARETGAPTSVVIGLLTTLTIGFTFGLVMSLSYGLKAGLSFGISLGVAIGLTVATSASTWTEDQPGFANLHFRGRIIEFIGELLGGFLSGITVGLAVGFIIGLAFGIPFSFVIGFPSGIIFGAVFGLIVALTGGFVFGLIS